MSRNQLLRRFSRTASLSAFVVLSLVLVPSIGSAQILDASPFAVGESGYCSSGCWVGHVSVANATEWHSSPPNNTGHGARHIEFSFTSTEANPAPPVAGTASIRQTLETPDECFSEEQYSSDSLTWSGGVQNAEHLAVSVNEKLSGVAGAPPEGYNVTVGEIAARGIESFVESGPINCEPHSGSTEESWSESFPAQLGNLPSSHPFGSDPTHIAGTEIITRSYNSEGLNESEEETIVYDLHFVDGSTIPPSLTCPEKGELGIYPDCHLPTCPEKGEVGTYPSCHHETCPEGEVGAYPSCRAPTCAELRTCKPSTCPEKGEVGVYPSCHVNHPPIAVKDFGLSTGKPTIGNVLANDHDWSGPGLTDS